jgi:hypothetical protein
MESYVSRGTFDILASSAGAVTADLILIRTMEERAG